MTKKEIVKKISEDIGLTQLKTKDIVQRTLDAIIQTLVSEGRIELRNFGVFEDQAASPAQVAKSSDRGQGLRPLEERRDLQTGQRNGRIGSKMDPSKLPMEEDDSDADDDNNGSVEPVTEPQVRSTTE